MTDQPAGPDRVITRVDAITTTVLDTLAILGLAAGTGWTIGERLGVGYGIAWAGVVVALLSAWAQRRAAGPRLKPVKRAVGEETVRLTVPGPRDPGNVHIAGGR